MVNSQTISVNLDGTPIVFECLDDIVEAFKNTKEALRKGADKPKETKRRGARFLLACLDAGLVKDPGSKVRKYCNTILD